MRLSQNLGWYCQGHCTVKQQLYHKLHSYICINAIKYILLSHNQLFTKLAFVLMINVIAMYTAFPFPKIKTINLVTFQHLEI